MARPSRLELLDDDSNELLYDRLRRRRDLAFQPLVCPSCLLGPIMLTFPPPGPIKFRYRHVRPTISGHRSLKQYALTLKSPLLKPYTSAITIVLLWIAIY